MLKANGYTAHYNGNGGGALIATPHGQLFRIDTHGVVTTISGSIEAAAVESTWRDTPATPDMIAWLNNVGLKCPATSGAALDVMAYLIGRIAIRGLEIKPFEAMNNDELLEHLRNHPQDIQLKKAG